MNAINIEDIELMRSGEMVRKALIGDTYVTVWMTLERQVVEYKCSTRRGDIVTHVKLPLHIHHIDRAFEHAVQEVIEQQTARVAAQEVQVVHACVDCGVELEDPEDDDDGDTCERCAAFETMQEVT